MSHPLHSAPAVSAQAQRMVRRAHDDLPALRDSARQERLDRLRTVRDVVRDSWLRSLRHLGDPSHVTAAPVTPVAIDDARSHHPLLAVLPVFRRLLVEPAAQTGLIVAISDVSGHLLWVEGDAAARRRAESMAFVPGADWSERAIGTSAPGTSLASGRAVQIAGAEHFAPIAQDWCCTAVPISHPATGELLGAVDLTGDEQAVTHHTLALVRAAVAAAEAELRMQALVAQLPVAPARPVRRGAARVARGLDLQVLGRDSALLREGVIELELSPRHSEIALLLAHHPAGLAGGELATLLHEELIPEVTIRAELARLRRQLQTAGAGLTLLSRPYRFDRPLTSDVQRLLGELDRGAHRRALERYQGAVLPASEAPGVIELRREVAGTLRERILADAAIEVLLDYLDLPEAAEDVAGLQLALQLLPPRSPRRARLLGRLTELGAA